MGDSEDTGPQSGTERSLPRELANAARDTERQGVGLASLRASIKALVSVANAVGFASVSESQGFAFAVASETSLDAKRSVASKFFDWGCDAVQQARECPEAVRLSGHWMVQVVQGWCRC